MAYGTLSVLDTLASSQQTVAEFGEDRAFEQIQAALAAHNAMTSEMLGQLVEITDERLHRFGTQDNMSMDELDEYGLADAQKVTAGQTVGLPLRKYGISLQWTRTYFMRARTDELAAQTTAAMEADIRNLQTAIKRAIFTPTNATFVDRLVDGVELPVKALINADSSSIPIGPNGETFDGSTHTHYLARAGGAVTASDVSGLLTKVAEHYNSGELLLFINKAQESTIRGFTSNFTPYVDARIIPAQDERVGRAALDTGNLYNRPIGLFDSAEVWIKPWVPADYLFAYLNGAPRPLSMRVDPHMGGDFQLVYEDERHPLRARSWERNFGIGVVNRTNGAVLYTGDTAYTAPTL